jgi:hypothetical protein
MPDAAAPAAPTTSPRPRRRLRGRPELDSGDRRCRGHGLRRLLQRRTARERGSGELPGHDRATGDVVHVQAEGEAAGNTCSSATRRRSPPATSSPTTSSRGTSKVDGQRPQSSRPTSTLAVGPPARRAAAGRAPWRRSRSVAPGSCTPRPVQRPEPEHEREPDPVQTAG